MQNYSEVILYLGDQPPSPKSRISGNQFIADLGMNMADQVNSLIKTAPSGGTLSVVNPIDISVSGNSVVGSVYNGIIDGISHVPKMLSTLPAKLSTGTLLVWLTTNGNIIALLVKEPPPKN